MSEALPKGRAAGTRARLEIVERGQERKRPNAVVIIASELGSS